MIINSELVAAIFDFMAAILDFIGDLVIQWDH